MKTAETFANREFTNKNATENSADILSVSENQIRAPFSHQ
jgi:hypothetical protein